MAATLPEGTLSLRMNESSSRGREEIRISIGLVILTSVAVVLRFIAKFRRRQRLGLEDWFALTGLVNLVDTIPKSVTDIAFQVLVYGLFVDGIICRFIKHFWKHPLLIMTEKGQQSVATGDTLLI